MDNLDEDLAGGNPKRGFRDNELKIMGVVYWVALAFLVLAILWFILQIK